MFNPHQISERLAVLAGLSLLAAMIVPNAIAVELLPEGGNEWQSDSVTGNQAANLDASTASYDWSAAPLLGLIALVVLVTNLAVYYAATRRNRQLAAR